MLEQDLASAVFGINEGQCSSVLLFNMNLNLVSHQICGMISAVIHLLDVFELGCKFKLFNFKGLTILIFGCVIVFEPDAININTGHSIITKLVVGDDREVMKIGVPDLVNQALLVLSIAIGFLLEDVNVVHHDLDSDATSGVLIEVKFTAVNAWLYPFIKVPTVSSDWLETFVLD